MIIIYYIFLEFVYIIYNYDCIICDEMEEEDGNKGFESKCW